MIGQPKTVRGLNVETLTRESTKAERARVRLHSGSQVEHKVRHGHFYFTDTQRMRRLGGAPSVNKASTFFARRIIAAILKLSYITI